CCTSVKTIEPNLTASGLCLNPANEPCPKACTTSADCGSLGQLCCDGVCADSCAKSCTKDSDCNGQICCKIDLNNFPTPPHQFKVSPACSGTPTYTSCTQCSSLG